MKEHLKNVFPTKTSLAVFIGYIGLFGQGLLVTASRKGRDGYPYNPKAVVLATDMVKLGIVSVIFMTK